MIVPNNMSDVISVFDVDEEGDLHASLEIGATRPIFFAAWPSQD
jgi:hypothetical protein